MLNPKYIANLEQRISAITNCQELAQINAEVLEYFTSLESSVLSQISIYGSLIISPTDLGSVISWINKMISTITGPYNQAVAMEAQLITLQASVMALIASKMGTLSCLRMLQTDLNTIMRKPQFGVTVNGLSVYGGG